MKIKALLNLTIVFFAIVFVACNDDMNSIGNSIQPEDDDIFVYADSVYITAKTVSLNDSVYARTEMPILGEYTDPIFGKVKSDFLCELYCPENLAFHEKALGTVDSVFLSVISESFIGDSLAPFGISAYKLNKNLEANFFTNTKVSDYCDMTELLGQGLFTIKDGEDYSGAKRYKIELDNSVGQAFYDDWKKTNGAIFKNTEALRDYFKGIYVTNTFGSGNMQLINTTILQIYYNYTGRNYDDTKDSVRLALLRLPVTSEVIQLNRVENKIPDKLFENEDTRTYLKSPAGVCTELTIPLKQIIKKAEETGKKNNKINAANFSIKGFTEEEEKTDLSRPTYLLFINKDSVENFFMNKKKPDSKTSFVMIRNASSNNNTYQFSASNSSASVTNNIANLVNHYIDYYKDKPDVPDLKYMVIPISIKSSSSVISNVYNLMEPATAILRTDEKNMKMNLIFSNYNKPSE